MGKVEGVADLDSGAIPQAGKVRSPSTVLEVPSILRLRFYAEAPHLRLQWSRHKVLKRDRWKCCYCGKQARRGGMERQDFTVDHVIPRSQGGRNTWGNTVCACLPCNSRKDNRTPHEAGMKMLFEPKTPRVKTLIASGEYPKEWKVYLQERG